MTGDGRYVLKGTGRDISYRDDGFHAMFENRENDSFSITTYVNSFDFVHGEAKAGVMSRFFLCNKSPNVFMGLTGTNGFQMIWRKCMDCNAEHSEVDSNVRYTQGWVKLEKLDDAYSGYWKHNEEDEWNLVDTVTVESSEPDLYTGLVVSSKKQDQLATAVFSDFSVEEASPSPTSSPVPTMTPPDLYLWPAGSTSECPEGASVPQDNCWEAALLLIENSDYFQSRPSYDSSILSVHDWNYTPCGCFLYDLYEYFHINFDTSTTGCFADNRSYSICTVPEDATPSPTSSPVPTMTPPDLYLWPAGSTSECPEGASVPQDDCLEAALLLIENSDIFQPLTSANSQLNVNDWNFTPCGCFLWRENNSNTYYIDFDTSTTACVADNRGNSICTVPPPSRRVLRNT
mmetsp:Transcript_2075/g.2222  ORF Transcript_2075/g.2222 Transcript_2075/m.2222 type:complete len:402 (-) Transcript_2075:259-1464(-)